MLEKFYPDRIEQSVYQIDFEGLYKKGYRGVIFDIDNTLVEHGKDADRQAEELFRKLRLLGMESCLLSNNKEERVLRFNRSIQTYYVYDAHKPSKKNYFRAMKKMGTSLSSTIFVGDQLFTDVWGAKRCGMANILVRPIDKKEEIQIVLKRYLEAVVLYFYERDCKKKGKSHNE